MRRKWTIFSPLSIILTLVLFAGLGATVLGSGGQTFSPGELTAKKYAGFAIEGFVSHADFEAECSRCHQPLTTMQAELCVTCHTRVSSQIVTAAGVHGNAPAVMACAACHPDHQGRDFDPLWEALWDFDHATTEFSLEHHMLDYDGNLIACTACHTEDQGLRVELQGCVACHADHQVAFMTQHILDFGDSCLACHDGFDRMVRFDHANTEFPLEGLHGEIDCSACHQDGRFEGTTLDCQGCHQEPLVHQGLFGTDCATCHRAQGWLPALVEGQPFEHASQTGFSLTRHAQDYAGQPLTCLGCHPNGLKYFEAGTCVNCHTRDDLLFMEQHLDFYGFACLACHDGVDRLGDFDHATVFPLEGRHASTACENCHLASAAGRVFKGTPLECYQCHTEPQIHAGFFGLQCGWCHTTEAWVPARLSQHDFPLDHGDQGVLECQLCHTDTYTIYTCFGCHEHQQAEVTETHLAEGVSSDELPNCTQCHPAGARAEKSG